MTLRRFVGPLCVLMMLAGCDLSATLGTGNTPPATPTSVAVAEQPATSNAQAQSAPTLVPTDAAIAVPTPAAPVATQASNPLSDTNGTSVEDIFSRFSPAVVRIELDNGLGSGFLIDKNGTIITNNHVAGGQSTVRVLFSGLFAAEGRVLGADPDSDIAVVKVDQLPDNIVPVTLGDSSALKVGQPVIAIGNPLGQDRTVTTGIVSALGRTLDEQEQQQQRQQGSFSIGGIIQTDAAINPGNSGGPLFNAAGEVIGMNTAVATIPSQNGGGQISNGIGFAVPVNLIKKVEPQLSEKGQYDHPYLGITLGNVITTLDAKQQNLPSAGVPIRASAQGGPAAKAGLNGDAILTAVNGQQVTSRDDLISYLELETKPGDTVTLSIVTSQGQKQDLKVQLGSRPRAEGQQ